MGEVEWVASRRRGGGGRHQSRWCAHEQWPDLECGGCDRPGDRGVVVMGSEAEQRGWGHMDFALKADLF